MKGVRNVVVGYAGGTTENPTYRSISDYTEAVRIEFDKSQLSFSDILMKFLEEMGGSYYSRPYSRQYRAAILVHNEDQREIALELIKRLSDARTPKKVYIDVEDATDFYQAEEYHQKYIEKQNRGNRY
jgi:peptide methionine sulfoxide reductase msrA/msrB